ncbi:MAG: hypothetical protein GEU80_17785 [Dehalococcoidia bacterium]|nr:hypothetical protein [Dehalococcoidia bacterium]
MAQALDPAVYQDAVASLQARAATAGFRIACVAGISVGGCAEAIGTERRGAFRRRAHAHNRPPDPPYGWICCLSRRPERLVTPGGRASALLAHEYAHLLAPSSGHGERWRRAIAAIGFPAQANRRRR